MPGKQALASLLYKVVSISSYLPTPPTYQHTHPTACGNFTLVHLINQGPDILDGIFKVPWSQGYTGSPWEGNSKSSGEMINISLFSDCEELTCEDEPISWRKEVSGGKSRSLKQMRTILAKSSYQGGLS